jgi:hypothetical protein
MRLTPGRLTAVSCLRYAGIKSVGGTFGGELDIEAVKPAQDLLKTV